MELLQVIIELRHGQPLKLFRPYEELYHSLTEKELPAKEIPLPGFELNISEKQMRVRVDPWHVAIILGNVPNIGYYVDNIIAVFKKVNDLVKVPPLVRLGLRSYWIQEAKVSFSELVSTYKQKIYKSNNIVEESVDVGASFMLKDGEYSANVTLGPMELSQLETMFIFKPPKLPKVAIFLDIDYYLVMEPTEVVENMLRDFVSAGLNYAGKQSQRLMNILLEEG